MTLPSLLDIFQRHRAKDTGVWKLGTDPNRLIFFEFGDIVFAQSTHPQDRLTYILVERGLLTQDQLDYAMANLKPGISVGKNLIDMGFITQRVLLDVARMQVERVVWGAMAVPDEGPQFSARELEANVVRLPFETPLLLLNGLLALQDRETMLDLLGVLNQVIVLESRRPQELSLPADLAKLPPLLDGTRTLLELARESGVEPMRLGAFALFLREMGWARLHELPPLNRAAVDLALSPEPEFASPALPEAQAESSPSLFASIAAASKPTTNLEHLSEALDELPEPEAEVSADPEEERPLPVHDSRILEEVRGEGVLREEGQALLQTPASELPLVVEPEIPEEEGPVPEPRISLPLEDEVEPLAVAFPPSLEGSASAPRSAFPWLRLTLLLLAVGLAAWAGWRWYQRPLVVEAPPIPAPTNPTVELPKPDPLPPAEPKPEPLPAEPKPPVVEQKPIPPPVQAPKPPLESQAARLQALRQGNLAQALALSETLVKAEPKAFTLRLLIACKEDTLRGIPDNFPGEGADLFVLPMSMRGGQACTQIFFGRFPTAKEAEAAINKLPSAFIGKGNRPKVFVISDIPRIQ